MAKALPSDKPLRIEQRANFPGLSLDYGLGLFAEQQTEVFSMCAQDMQFTYPNPLSKAAERGDCAYSWYADRGDWIYAIDKSQRNAFVPQAWPEWLRGLSHKVNAASPLTTLGTGWNCCLISWGTSCIWTHGEDPWHRDDSFVGDVVLAPASSTVTVTYSRGESKDGPPASFSINPRVGSYMVSSGMDWKIAAESRTPFYYVSFRLIDPLRVIYKQHMAKVKHRLPQYLATERRIVPRHVEEAQRNGQDPDDLLPAPLEVVVVQPQASKPRAPKAAFLRDPGELEPPAAFKEDKEPEAKKKKPRARKTTKKKEPEVVVEEVVAEPEEEKPPKTAPKKQKVRFADEDKQAVSAAPIKKRTAPPPAAVPIGRRKAPPPPPPKK
jgi:hypothetical protein